MSGVLDWLDSGISKIGTIAGKAVEAAGNVATTAAEVSNKLATAGARGLDQTPVDYTSPLQINPKFGVPNWILYAGGLALLGGVIFMIARRK